MSYRAVRVHAAHTTLGKRHPVLTIIGPLRIFLGLLGVAVLGLGWWAWSTVDWSSLALWVIPGVGLVALLVWVTLWWTGRT